jgi:hypothetical protein
MFENYVDLIPEDKREAFKAEAAKVVNLDEYLGKEDNLKGLLDKDFFKKSVQSLSDTKAELLKKKYIETEVPKMLEEERKKGQKNPLELKIEQIEKERDEEKKARLREQQKNRALSALQAAKVPTELVDRYVGTTDEETDEALKQYVAVVSKYRDDAVTEALKAIGAQPKPTGGADGKMMSLAEFTKLPPKEQSSYMNSGGKLIE